MAEVILFAYPVKCEQAQLEKRILAAAGNFYGNESIPTWRPLYLLQAARRTNKTLCSDPLGLISSSDIHITKLSFSGSVSCWRPFRKSLNGP